MTRRTGDEERRASAASEPSLELADATLMARLAEGDRQALAALYDRHAPHLFAAAMYIAGERMLAEDVVHDVFLDAWSSAGRYDAGRGSVRTWLYLRLRSRAFDALRAQQRRHAAPKKLTPPEAVVADDGQFDHETARAALRALSNEQRETLELAYFGGMTMSEIAAHLRIPLGTVKSRLAAALAKLRAALVRHG